MLLVRERGSQRDRAAERVADEVPRQERRDDVDERERLGRQRRLAPAGQVGRDDVEARAERRHLALPEARVAERRVEEDDAFDQSSFVRAGIFTVSPRIVAMSVLDHWRFCPRCAGDLTRPRRASSAAVREHYCANSIPGVQGILERDGRVLLARRANEPRRGHWDLPGGFLNETEDPIDGLRREFAEETGLEVEPVELLRIDIEPYETATSSP